MTYVSKNGKNFTKNNETVIADIDENDMQWGKAKTYANRSNTKYPDFYNTMPV